MTKQNTSTLPSTMYSEILWQFPETNEVIRLSFELCKKLIVYCATRHYVFSFVYIQDDFRPPPYVHQLRQEDMKTSRIIHLAVASYKSRYLVQGSGVRISAEYRRSRNNIVVITAVSRHFSTSRPCDLSRNRYSPYLEVNYFLGKAYKSLTAERGSYRVIGIGHEYVKDFQDEFECIISVQHIRLVPRTDNLDVLIVHKDHNWWLLSDY